jgi:surface polysaccharide O-acyltransferase-like enzyme
MAKNLRNIAVVLVLAALVVLIPGGGRGATVAIQAVSLAFLASIGWIASLLYRQHRTELYSLGDTRRAILYVALGLALVTFSATTKLWATAAGELVWFALIGAAAYAVIAIVWSARRY